MPIQPPIGLRPALVQPQVRPVTPPATPSTPAAQTTSQVLPPQAKQATPSLPPARPLRRSPGQHARTAQLSGTSCAPARTKCTAGSATAGRPAPLRHRVRPPCSRRQRRKALVRRCRLRRQPAATPGAPRPGQVLSGPRQPLPGNVAPGAPRPAGAAARRTDRAAAASREFRPSRSSTERADAAAGPSARRAARRRALWFRRVPIWSRNSEQQQQRSPMPGQAPPPALGADARAATPRPGQPLYQGPPRPGQPDAESWPRRSRWPWWPGGFRPGGPGGRPGGPRPMHPTSRGLIGPGVPPPPPTPIRPRAVRRIASARSAIAQQEEEGKLLMQRRRSRPLRRPSIATSRFPKASP